MTASRSTRRSIRRGTGDVHSPAYARRGVGRMILALCEAAAAAEGFTRLALMSTLSGEALYTACGFRPVERLLDSTGGAAVPLVRMEKPVDPSLARLTHGTRSFDSPTTFQS